MIDVDNLDPTDRATLGRTLIEQLEANEETTFGPTDSAWLAAAARVYVELIDAGQA